MKIVGIKHICELLNKTERTIRADIVRKPQCVPPPIIIPGTNLLLWKTDVIDDWLDKHQIRVKGAHKKTFNVRSTKGVEY